MTLCSTALAAALAAGVRAPKANPAATAAAIARAPAAAAPGEHREVAVFPPFPHLALVGAALAGSAVALGAQDLSPLPPGAATGAVPGEMLRDLGVAYALVGHSERRQLFGETDE